MNVPQSGLLAFTQNTISTTAAQASANVSNPPTSGTLGTPQIAPSGSSNAYPVTYGTASAVLTNPGVYPANDGYLVVGANAPSSGINSVNGFTPIGASQGNCMNQSAKTDAMIPAAFNLIFSQLITMAAYTSRL